MLTTLPLDGGQLRRIASLLLSRKAGGRVPPFHLRKEGIWTKQLLLRGHPVPRRRQARTRCFNRTGFAPFNCRIASSLPPCPARGPASRETCQAPLPPATTRSAHPRR